MVWILRLILFALVIYFFYLLSQLLFTQNRKLNLARDQKRFLILDDGEHVRKNLLVTYKGAVFEGEKYLGTTENAIEVVSIFVWCVDTASLKGLVKEDLYFIEKKLIELYPSAKIHWKNPMKELLNEIDD